FPRRRFRLPAGDAAGLVSVELKNEQHRPLPVVDAIRAAGVTMCVAFDTAAIACWSPDDGHHDGQCRQPRGDLFGGWASSWLGLGMAGLVSCAMGFRTMCRRSARLRRGLLRRARV